MLLTDEEIAKGLKKLEGNNPNDIVVLTPIEIKRYTRVIDYMRAVLKDELEESARNLDKNPT